MKKKKLNGFTLVELILVMAIFGILMAAVMSIIKPLNKISKRATLQEANSAAVDNMKTYLESSLRYSECVDVCVGGLTNNQGFDLKKFTPDELNKMYGVVDYKGNKLDTAPTAEEAAVINFLDNHYSNRIDPSLTQDTKPLKGYVRMLKIDNANGGKVTENLYTFNAGYTFTNFDEKGEPVSTLGRVNSDIKLVSSEDVINDSYYENYSFYISPGYNKLETVDDSSKISGFASAADGYDEYYGALLPIDETIKSIEPSKVFSKDLFSLSIVTYKNDVDDDGKAENRGAYSVSDTESYVAFKSPFAISNANMSLVNINTSFNSDSAGKWITDSVGPVRYNGAKKVDGKPATEWKNYTPTDKVTDETTGNWKYTAISSDQAPKINAADRLYPHAAITGADSDDCIYFIYTLPDLV